jgi:hypothetical protein
VRKVGQRTSASADILLLLSQLKSLSHANATICGYSTNGLTERLGKLTYGRPRWPYLGSWLCHILISITGSRCSQPLPQSRAHQSDRFPSPPVLVIEWTLCYNNDNKENVAPLNSASQLTQLTQLTQLPVRLRFSVSGAISWHCGAEVFRSSAQILTANNIRFLEVASCLANKESVHHSPQSSTKADDIL